MTQIARRAILAFALMAGMIPAIAQVPPPVPGLPDTERRTSYSISSSNCACAVNFALYGDGTDYQNWIEVWLNGVRVNYNDTTYGWSITSPSGPLANLPRPITNAVLTFNTAQTGTVQIVGARRPRRVSQFSENRGVAARDLNQALTDIVAQNRETWDKTNDVTGRAIVAPPGETMLPLPQKSSRANLGLCFDNNGNPSVCGAAGSTVFTAGSGITFSGTNPTTLSANIAAGYGLSISGTNPITISSLGIGIGAMTQIETFGGGSAFTTSCVGAPDNTPALNAAVAAGYQQVFFGAGLYCFNSRPAVFGAVPVRLVGVFGSTSVIRNYSEAGGSGSGLFTWGPNAVDEGGVEGMTILAQTGTSGGAAISMISGANLVSGFQTFKNVVMSFLGSGSWFNDIYVDGSANTSGGAQGWRDLSFHNIYLFNQSPGIYGGYFKSIVNTNFTGYWDQFYTVIDGTFSVPSNSTVWSGTAIGTFYLDHQSAFTGTGNVNGLIVQSGVTRSAFLGSISGGITNMAPFGITIVSQYGIALPAATVSTLPGCGASTSGLLAMVSDANGASWNSPLSGGGTTNALALCNGSTWIAH